MNFNEQKIMYQSIARIHHIWFDEDDISDPLEKITALFKVIEVLAPYRCCSHVQCLWLAYLSAKEEYLWNLAQYRHRLFGEGLESLLALANKLPASVRA